MSSSPSTTPDKRSEFLPHIHRLRGIAILLVVTEHCAWALAWPAEAPPPGLRALTFNSSVIFMLLAGYLFQYLSAARLAYFSYLKRKLLTVLLPFVIAAMPNIIATLLRPDLLDMAPVLGHLSTVERVGWFLLYPGMLAVSALWFIPVITSYYLAAPLLSQLDRLRFGYFLLPVLIVASNVMERPPVTWGHNLALSGYFLSCYVTGMWLSRRRELIDPWLSRRLILLGLGVIVLFSLETVVYWRGDADEWVRAFSAITAHVDWSWVFQILLAVFLLIALQRFNHTRMRWADKLGDISFPLFFYHTYVLMGVVWAFNAMHIPGAWWSLVVALVVVVAACWTLVAVSHRVFGRWSRMLIGG